MKYFRMLVVISIALFCGMALAQVAGSPAPVPAPSPAGVSGVVSWIAAHEAILSGLVVAVLDLVFALNPNANAPDGVLHMVYLWLKKLSGQSAAQ